MNQLSTKSIDDMSPDEITHALSERFHVVPELLDDETLQDLLAAEAWIREYNKATIEKNLLTCAKWSSYVNQIEIQTLEGKLLRSYKVLSNPDQDPWASRILLLDQEKFPEVHNYDDVMTLDLDIIDDCDLDLATPTNQLRNMPKIIVAPFTNGYGDQAAVYFDNEEDACRLAKKFWNEVHPGRIAFGREPTLKDWGRELTYGDRTLVDETFAEEEKEAWRTLFLGNGCPLSQRAWEWLNKIGRK